MTYLYTPISSGFFFCACPPFWYSFIVFLLSRSCNLALAARYFSSSFLWFIYSWFMWYFCVGNPTFRYGSLMFMIIIIASITIKSYPFTHLFHFFIFLMNICALWLDSIEGHIIICRNAECRRRWVIGCLQWEWPISSTTRILRVVARWVRCCEWSTEIVKYNCRKERLPSYASPIGTPSRTHSSTQRGLEAPGHQIESVRKEQDNQWESRCHLWAHQ